MEDHTQVREGRIRVLVVGLLVVMVSGIALAIVGAMGPAILVQLDLSAAQFGLANAGFFVATTLVAYPAGRQVDVKGWRQVLRFAGFVAAGGLGVGAVAGGPLVLAVAMSLSGAALGFAMPACVQAMKSVADDGRLATPIGYLHAVIPAIIMVVGAAVAAFPIVEAWRVAFGAAAVVAVLVTALVPRPHRTAVDRPALVVDVRHEESDELDPDTGSLPLGDIAPLLIAVTFSAFASGILVTSFAVGVVSLGLSVAQAASLLSVGTLVGVTLRIVSGIVSDRIGSSGAAPAGLMLAVGAGGAILVASGVGNLFLSLGAVVALGFGLSWPGLLYAAVARRAGSRTGSAIGLVEVCASAGAASGPFLFGLLLDGSGSSAAWYLMGSVLAAAALTSLIAAWVDVSRSDRLDQPDRGERDRRPVEN